MSEDGGMSGSDGIAAADVSASAQANAKPKPRALPKRFYKAATVAAAPEGFALTLDGKGARTPGGAPLALPSESAARLIAAEWSAAGEFIDPAAMPVTRLANSAIDGVSAHMQATADEIVKYLGSDLVCYRAEGPQGLVEAQAAAWDPVLDFARSAFGARFILAQGVVFAEQPPAAIQNAARALFSHAQAEDGAFRLAALSSMTALTGSALIALAHVGGALDLAAAWSAAHVDEDHQIRQWGADEEAQARRAARFADMKAASAFFAAL